MTDSTYVRLGLPLTASPMRSCVLRSGCSTPTRARFAASGPRASASTGRCSAPMPRDRRRVTRQPA